MVVIVLWAETGARHDYFQLLVFLAPFFSFWFYLNSELTYYIFLGIGVRQMTSPRVSELSSKKELPVIFLSLPARELATIHILLP